MCWIPPPLPNVMVFGAIYLIFSSFLAGLGPFLFFCLFSETRGYSSRDRKLLVIIRPTTTTAAAATQWTRRDLRTGHTTEEQQQQHQHQQPKRKQKVHGSRRLSNLRKRILFFFVVSLSLHPLFSLDRSRPQKNKKNTCSVCLLSRCIQSPPPPSPCLILLLFPLLQ